MPEVQAHLKQLRLGEEALTDDLPAQFKLNTCKRL